MFRRYDYAGARLLMQKLCVQRGIAVSHLLSHWRHPALVAVRREVSQALHGAGFSYPEIGVLMNRNHASIHYLVNGRVRRGVTRSV